MFCNNCGTNIPGNVHSCPNCGAPIVNPVQPQLTQDMLPPEYQPLSPWAYFGLQVLFAVPIVGFVFLIIFSCSRGNYNRRAFARSYWCSLALSAIILIIVLLAVGGISGLVSEFI